MGAAACSRRQLPPSNAQATPTADTVPSGWSRGAALLEPTAGACGESGTAATFGSLFEGQEQSAFIGDLRDLAGEARAAERRRQDVIGLAASILRSACGPDVSLTKAISVDGRLVYVIDGAIPAGMHKDLYECLQGDAFRRTEFARPDTREFRHHIVEYSPQKFRRTPLFATVDRLVQLFFPEQPMQVYRIYTNAVMYGDAAFVHRDSNDSDHVTALLYPNPEWASEMGGETVFYSEDNEIATAVEPKPGRLCLFHGNIQHKGSPPSRLFWGSRFTTAFKYAPVEATSDVRMT